MMGSISTRVEHPTVESHELGVPELGTARRMSQKALMHRFLCIECIQAVQCLLCMEVFVCMEVLCIEVFVCTFFDVLKPAC